MQLTFGRVDQNLSRLSQPGLAPLFRFGSARLLRLGSTQPQLGYINKPPTTPPKLPTPRAPLQRRTPSAPNLSPSSPPTTQPMLPPKPSTPASIHRSCSSLAEETDPPIHRTPCSSGAMETGPRSTSVTVLETATADLYCIKAQPSLYRRVEHCLFTNTRV
jgi:hypothetical protein